MKVEFLNLEEHDLKNFHEDAEQFDWEDTLIPDSVNVIASMIADTIVHDYEIEELNDRNGKPIKFGLWINEEFLGVWHAKVKLRVDINVEKIEASDLPGTDGNLGSGH